MAMTRMDREQFFEKLSALDEDRLKKALWNLYWRGTASVRQRIEGEIEPGGPSRRRAEPESVDPARTLSQVSEFADLARSGAYLGGDRRVTPKQRTRWRFTFRQLAKEVELALGNEDVEDGATAMAVLIDLAREMNGYDYFRSEDPIEAARFVVSDEVALLWSRLRDQLGFDEFARRAAPQLVRWESTFGWTRTGFGQVRPKETSLAAVLDRMLSVHDAWVTFARQYEEALDALADQTTTRSRRERYSTERGPKDRASNLSEWHSMLLDRLWGSEAEGVLDRLSEHPALGGPDLTYFKALLADRRGDQATARRLTTRALDALPGHEGYLRFAAQIGAPLPARAEAAAGARLERLMSNPG